MSKLSKIVYKLCAMNRTTEVPDSMCPTCFYVMDRATGAYEDDIAPSKGDVSICAKCGTLLIFDENLHLTEMSETDITELKCKHPDV